MALYFVTTEYGFMIKNKILYVCTLTNILIDMLERAYQSEKVVKLKVSNTHPLCFLLQVGGLEFKVFKYWK